MADTYTWVPLPLATMAPMVGLVKFQMPNGKADDDVWAPYCMRDAQIVYRVVSELVVYLRDNHLGNWQPTGAGMAYATWRHKYMSDRILVHDDDNALRAERDAMYAGRAEAWKHGKIQGPTWTEVDMRNAYVTIAGECDVPRKLHMHCGRLNSRQYYKLVDKYRLLVRADVRCDLPILPYREGAKTIWPVGTFQGWYWDCELQCAKSYGAEVTVLEAYCYVRAPALQDWAKWILSIVQGPETGASPIVRTWLKHCSRAFIGRLALRTKSWELFGANPDGVTGISHMTDVDTGVTRRLMHVGDRTLVESDPGESENSVPMVTGWIMAECRARLWTAMYVAGLDHLAHVDTDSLLVDAAGLGALRAYAGADWERLWAVKGSWRTVELSGPRAYRRGKERVTAGIPRQAVEVGPGRFEGERWASLATDLEARGDGVVTTWLDHWTMTASDPRRVDRAGVAYETDALRVGVT